MEELDKALKSSKKHSAPGPSGFTYNWWRKFWPYLKYLLLITTQSIFNNNRLPKSQSYGMISLLPKGEKDRYYLENWRPLTMLSCAYKLISKCIADRINNVLYKLIHKDQNGFVPGRTIHESLRNTQDIIDHIKKKNKTGMMILVDFKKAFDSISHEYIYKVLRSFGFCEYIIKWIKILIGNYYVSTINGGRIANRFKLNRGCKQGDPISSAIFILAIEILCEKLRNSPTLKGLSYKTGNILLSLFADDMTIFLEHSEEQLREAIKIINDFKKLSGLEIQLQKTQITIFGKKPENINICPEIKLQRRSDFKLLGIQFDVDKDITKEEEEKLIEKVKTKAKHWQYRFITPMGKCDAARSFLMSQLNHYHAVRPITVATQIRLEKIIDTFIHPIRKGNKQAYKYISSHDAQADKQNGGINEPNIINSLHSYNVGWLKKLYYKQDENLHWINMLKQDLQSYSKGMTIKRLFNMSIVELERIEKSEDFTNKFWKSVIKSTVVMIKNNNLGNNNSIINQKWNENPLLLEIDHSPPYTKTSEDEVLKKIRIEDYNRLSNIQIGHFYPRDAIIFNGRLDPDTGRWIHELPNRFMNYNEFMEQRVREQYRGEGYLEEKHYNSYIGMLKANLSHYNQDISYVKRLDISLLEDMFIKQGKKGCNKFARAFKNPNNKTIKKTRRKKEYEWEEIFKRPIQITTKHPIPIWQPERDREWNFIHKAKANINFSNEDTWLLLKIIRRRLPTNKTVEDWKKEPHRIKENEQCDICKVKGSSETIEHIYLECPRVNAFLIELKLLFNKNISIFPGPDWKNDHYLFGTQDREHSIFYMVLRSYIWYDCKKKKREPTITDFLGTLINRTEKICKASVWKDNDRPVPKRIITAYERILEELKRYVSNDTERITFRNVV